MRLQVATKCVPSCPIFRVEMQPGWIQDGDTRERLRAVSEPGHRRIGSAETTLSSNQMTGASVAFDEVPAVREADTDPSRTVREDVFERPT